MIDPRLYSRSVWGVESIVQVFVHLLLVRSYLISLSTVSFLVI